MTGDKFTLREQDGSERIVTLTPYVAPAPVPVAESPTGHTPSLLWTGEQQAVWNRMREEKHPWMVWTLRQADAQKNYWSPNFMKSAERGNYLKARYDESRAVLADLGLAR